MINLCECKPGDYLLAQNGRVYIYSQLNSNYGSRYYPHIIKSTKFVATFSVTNEGCHMRGSRCSSDIIKIIPQETPNIYFTLYENLRLLKRTSEIA